MARQKSEPVQQVLAIDVHTFDDIKHIIKEQLDLANYLVLQLEAAQEKIKNLPPDLNFSFEIGEPAKVYAIFKAKINL